VGFGIRDVISQPYERCIRIRREGEEGAGDWVSIFSEGSFQEEVV